MKLKELCKVLPDRIYLLVNEVTALIGFVHIVDNQAFVVLDKSYILEDFGNLDVIVLVPEKYSICVDTCMLRKCD